MTAEAFGRGRALDGRSSSELLCDRVAGSRHVRDLGCGDGLLLELLARADGRRLAGLDLSPRSLALARRRPALSAARLEEGRAQALPFADDSFDACVSHLALMLMGEIEQVAAEIARVLCPGGVLLQVPRHRDRDPTLAPPMVRRTASPPGRRGTACSRWWSRAHATTRPGRAGTCRPGSRVLRR
nr:class I SAM-dependent methyltransferase [Streptomyces sabulosicollis]